MRLAIVAGVIVVWLIAKAMRINPFALAIGAPAIVMGLIGLARALAPIS